MILYVPLILSAKAAYFFIHYDYLNCRHGFIEPSRQSLQPAHAAFYLVSRRPPDWRRKQRQLRREFLHLPCPGFSERGDRAGAVAAQERDLLPQHPETRRVGTDLGCSGLDAVLRRNERRKIKTEGRLLAFAASARKSLPVRRVPPRNEANCNKPREMTAKSSIPARRSP